ncbi:MAG: N-6 DNA methylase [Gemmatales bacterium]|nr:SAM-dependent methyltransferase [Gemmatales bacterium]MDW7994615.1 N-6 DNA methylase [Gemmatales bacterium]
MSDFSDCLRNYLDQLRLMRSRGASEDSIRDGFLQFLRESFPRLAVAEPLQLEKHIPGLRVRGGFADVLYGDLIFEFERRLDDAKRREGQQQLLRYLLNQEHPERYFGVLSDGETLEVYALREGRLEPVNALQLRVEQAAECRLWLDCYLFHEKQLRPTTDDVALRFGQHSPTFWRSLYLLRQAWQRHGSHPAAQTKFAEWQSLLSIVYGSDVGHEELFLRHTYLALFARVLAFVVLNRRAPHSGEIDGLISGQTFVQLGLDNFVGEDFFSWAALEKDTVRSLLHGLACRLTAAYSLTDIQEDLLKELYQELVDPETRHDLGEFYTPDWLAELTLRQAGFPGQNSSASLIDPACGSGTFLVTAIRLLRESGMSGAQLVSHCAQHLAGLDVHPLAVTIARTNFVLALGRDLQEYRQSFHVPIYMADTLALPNDSLNGQVLSIPVRVDDLAQRTGKKKPRHLPHSFDVPADMAHQPSLFNQCVDKLFELADPAYVETDAHAGFRRWLDQRQVPQPQLWLNNLRLMRWLMQAPATDTVWQFILKNAWRPALLAWKKFHFVVGNPPWLSYRYIRRRDYQERVRRLVLERYHLLNKRDAHLFTQTELATLFFAFCADRYLAEQGTLAFVMPRSILTGAKQHAHFRRYYVSQARLLVDCEQVIPLFHVPACVLIWVKRDSAATQSVSQAVPLLQLAGQLPRRNLSWPEAQRALALRQSTYSAPSPLGKSPYFERLRQGATIVPRCLWFVRPMEALVTDVARPQLETDPAIEPQAKPPWKGIRLRGRVEADFLFATLLSDDMLPFGWRQLSLVVLPWTRGKLLTDTEAVRLSKTGLAHWLRQAEDIWNKHRKSQEELLDYLDWQGKLTAQKPTGVYKLLYNTSGTHLCACVIDTTKVSKQLVHGLPVRGFVGDTKTYWLDLRNAAEAYYLSAVLNAPSIDKEIKPYQTKGVFGATRGGGERDIHRRPFEVVQILTFDRTNEHHRRLANLGRSCHKRVLDMVRTMDEKTLGQPIGKLRQLIRRALQAELDEIDQLVRTICLPGP